MLTERDLELLTACVDGELSPRQRRHVDRLLARSEEARALLRQLQGDSRQVIDLPRVPAPPDLAGTVTAAVAKMKRRPVPPRPRPMPVRTFPTWTGWAAAAAVLLAVGVGTFLQYSSSGPSDPVVRNKDNKSPEVVKNGPDEGGLARNVVVPKQSNKHEDDPPEEDPITPKPETPKPTPQQGPVPINKPIVEKKPNEPVFGDGSVEPFSKLERVELVLPVILRLHDLNKADEAKKLREQLDGHSAVRIELPAKNATRAFDRVKAAMEARKMTLVIDPAAQLKLKKPQFHHDYAVFLENVTPADLADLLAAIGALDKAAGEKKASEQHFTNSLVVRPTSAGDQKELAGMVGVDPFEVRPAAPKLGAVDLHKPLSDQTGGQVDDVLDGKRAPRPNTTEPGPSVLVLPLGSRSRSAEVKKFLEGRKPAREGTLQVFLVLRQLPS